VSDTPDRSESTTRTTAAEAEAAAIRRRWITLGEGLAVVAVVISGLTLWNNWSERADSAAVKTSDARQASQRAATLVLVASGSGERALTLKPASADQSVQSQTIAFPSALELDPAETTGEPRIEAAWFDSALKKARAAAKLPDDSRGDERLPVVVTTRFLVDGEAHEDVALYDIGYSITGRWLAGHSVTLRGVSLVSRVKPANARATLDKRWTTLLRR
jgi:hypothetical protein